MRNLLLLKHAALSHPIHMRSSCLDAGQCCSGKVCFFAEQTILMVESKQSRQGSWMHREESITTGKAVGSPMCTCRTNTSFTSVPRQWTSSPIALVCLEPEAVLPRTGRGPGGARVILQWGRRHSYGASFISNACLISNYLIVNILCHHPRGLTI